MTRPDCHSATRTPRRRRARAATAVTAGLVAIAGLTAVAPAGAAGPSCSVASAKRVKSALGITVGPPSVTTNGPVTICQFRVSAGLLVRFETHASESLFAFGRKSFGTHGAPTRTVTGIGAKAYSSSLQGSNTIVVLKNATELLVTSTLSLTKLEALARLILPSL